MKRENGILLGVGLLVLIVIGIFLLRNNDNSIEEVAEVPATATSDDIQPEEEEQELPTAEPSPTASSNSGIPDGPVWLMELNTVRAMADLPPVTENETMSAAAEQHSRYMLYTADFSHKQAAGAQHTSAEGLDAAQNGNLAGAYYDGATDDWGVEYWISAPFHLVPMLNPRISEVGHGIAKDPGTDVKIAYTLDVSTKRAQENPLVAGATYPILFPKDGGQMWINKFTLHEFPNPREACGYGDSIGAPIVVLFGRGDLSVEVLSSSLQSDSGSIPLCNISENSFAGSSGKQILDKQDAVILLPASAPVVGETYTVSLETNIESLTWSFEVVSSMPDLR